MELTPHRLFPGCVLVAALLAVAQGCLVAFVLAQVPPYKLLDDSILIDLLTGLSNLVAALSVGSAILSFALCRRYLRRHPWVIPVATTCLTPALILMSASTTFAVGAIASGGGSGAIRVGWRAASEFLPIVSFGLAGTLPIAVVGSAIAVIRGRRQRAPG